EIVHGHGDEAIRDRRVDAATELEGVLESLGPIVETTLDRLAEHLGHVVKNTVAEIPASDHDAERKRQARLEQPPLTEIENLHQAVALERELALVDEETGLGAPRRNLLADLLERPPPRAKVPEHEPKCKERSPQPSGNPDLRRSP